MTELYKLHNLLTQYPIKSTNDKEFEALNAIHDTLRKKLVVEKRIEVMNNISSNNYDRTELRPFEIVDLTNYFINKYQVK